MRIQTFSILAGTAACNARCPYCISKMTGIRETGFRLPEVNWRNFRKACRLAQVNGVSTVLITGKGEPTLYPGQITRFLERLGEFDFPLIEIQTNGLSLLSGACDRHLKRWVDLGLNTMALSVVHYENGKNRSIFTPGGNYPDLGALVHKLHSFGCSVRLSCILMRRFIDSPAEISRLADYARALSVEQLTVRRLGIVADAEHPGIREWCVNHALSGRQFRRIARFLDRNARRLLTLSHGAVVYEIGGQNLCLTDCVMLEPSTDRIRTLIFFPDGHLRFDWNYGGAILL
jgi:molybdenum cofactor biosynthesis enzyme MoaA